MGDLIRSLATRPLVVEALFGALLFAFVLLLFRRVRKVAEELERRKALGDYVRGLDEFLRGDFRDGAKTLERVLERDPENVEARIALGDCRRELGDPAEAKKHHHHVHKVFGHELARNFLSLGRDELALGHFDRAVEAFERCLDLHPGEPGALAGLAHAYAEGGDPVEAARYLRALYPGGPAESMGLKDRREAAARFCDAGRALLEEGDPEAAVKLFTEALAFSRQSLRARTGLLRAAWSLGDKTRAKALIERHLGELRRLADKEETLFEPASTREAPPDTTGAPGPADSSLLPARVGEVGGIVAAVAEKTARYACAECGALLRDYSESCPACKAVGTVAGLEPLLELYTLPVADFRRAVDAVEENAAHFQALAHQASLGDEQSMQRLLEKGERALYEVFAILPVLEARRYLGTRLAALGEQGARVVAECRSARAKKGSGATPSDAFAAAFYLALGGEQLERRLASLGAARDPALAGILADPRLGDGVRDAALRLLEKRGPDILGPVVDAIAGSGDAGGIERGAALVREWGAEAVETLERDYLQAKFLARLFRGRTGKRRRACADILARSGLPEAAPALARAAAREKDAALRAHYAAAKERAEQGAGR